MGVDERSIAGTRYILIGKVASSIILFLLSIIVARYLGPGMYGALSIALTTIAFIAVLVDGGLNRSMQKHISQYLKDDAMGVGDTLIKVFHLKLTLALISFVIVYLVSPIFAGIFNSKILESLMKVGSVLLASTIILEYQTAVLQGYERFKYISMAGILEAILKLLLVFSIIYMGWGGAVEVMQGYTASAAIVALALTIMSYSFIIKMRKRVVRPLEKDLFRDVLNYSPPLLLSSIFFIFYTKFDILVLGYLSNTTDLGQYSLAIGIVDNLIIPVAAIEATVLPIAASLYGKMEGEEKLGRLFNETICLGLLLMLPVIFGLAVVSSVLVEDVYGPQYRDTGMILLALTPFMLTKTMAVLNGAYLIAVNEAIRFMKYTLWAAALNLVLLFLLIPTFGVYGAVAARVLSHAILTGAMLYYIIPRFDIRIDASIMYKNFKIIISSLCMAGICYLVLAYLDGPLGLGITIAMGAAIYPLLLHIFKVVPFSELARIATGDLKLDD